MLPPSPCAAATTDSTPEGYPPKTAARSGVVAEDGLYLVGEGLDGDLHPAHEITRKLSVWAATDDCPIGRPCRSWTCWRTMAITASPTS